MVTLEPPKIRSFYNKNQQLYANALPFNGRLAENIDSMKKRIEIGKASLIIYDGQMGEGKTTLMIHNADYFQGKEIDFAKQYAMGGEDFIEKLRLCYQNNLPVIVYDEAGDFSRKAAITKFNRTLNRVFEIFRALKILILLGIPNFYHIDPGLFDKGVARMLVNVHGRLGFKYGNYRAYGPDEMGWLRYNMDKKFPYHKQKAYKKVFPNFYGHFYNLPPHRADALDNLSTEGKLDILQQSNADVSGLLAYKEIAQKLERTPTWVKQKVSALKIQPVEIYKRKKFFDPSIVARLQPLKIE